MKKILPFAAAATLAVFGMGCNPSPAPAPSNNGGQMNLLEMKYDACQLLTKADAEATLHGTVKDPLRNVSQTADGKTTVSDCTYSQPLPAGSTDISKIGTAGLLIRKAASQAEADKVFTDAMNQSKTLSGVDAVAISNLGDRAYWAGGSLTQMNVLKGDAWYIVNVNLPGGNAEQAALDLAKTVIGKIN
ncbi:MAG TPA: hypothetical protein VMU11_04160 [Verrucomicrobiae bacterium]|nr:hypothetical protein [Verrucomicrobiae bacterium]